MRNNYLAAVLLIAVCGCSRPMAPDSAYDSHRAREILITALDAWQAGQAHLLGRREPPVRFVDDDLIEGRKLVGYQLERPDAMFGPFEDVHVELVLKTREETEVRRKAIYQVSLDPSPAVLRCDH